MFPLLLAAQGRPKVAVVLSGGGAKGTAHIGALKVIEKAGIPIDYVVGTSMGAIVGGLYAIGYTPEQLDSMVNAQNWKFLLSDAPNPKDVLLDDRLRSERYVLSVPFTLKSADISDAGIIKGKNIAQLFSVLTDGYQDSVSFSHLPVPFACVSENLVDGSEVVFHKGILATAMRSSMSIPGVFAPVDLNGMVLIDGGMVNNVPVDVLAERGYKNLIVIRIYGIGVDTERRTELPEDVNVYRIAPRRNLGGILEFEKKRTRRSMTLGYFDAKRLLYGLAGRKYYFYLPHTEAYYFNRLMTEIQIFRHYLSAHLEQAGGEGSPGCRMYTEHVFPALAEKFKLKPDWDYRELYGAVLEVCARSMDLEVFDIYTADGIMERVHRILGKS